MANNENLKNYKHLFECPYTISNLHKANIDTIKQLFYFWKNVDIKSKEKYKDCKDEFSDEHHMMEYYCFTEIKNIGRKTFDDIEQFIFKNKYLYKGD